MKIETGKKINISNYELKKADLLNDLCEYSVLLNEAIIPISSGKDRFFNHHFSSGTNYSSVSWTLQLLNELDKEGKIEILDEYGHSIRISDFVLEEYKSYA